MDNTKINIPILATHASLALLAEEVRLEVTMVITTPLRTAPYVSLEHILTSAMVIQGQRLVNYVQSGGFRRRLHSANAPYVSLEDILTSVMV